MVKKFVTVLAVVVASVTLLMPAAQAKAHCVTRHEGRRVHTGMSEARVSGIFDTNGRVARKDGPVTVRSYTPCRHLHAVSVSYRNGHMFKKRVF